jgi:mono/diheme cytochrome c family protein
MASQHIIAACIVMFGLAIVASPTRAAQKEEGRAHYLRYCAACHGAEGKGDGTVSRSLKLKPLDLTQLQKRNKGVFPSDKIMATIDGRTRIDAHGESKMPVWGEIFEKQATAEKDPSAASAAKVTTIVEYLSTIQR